MSKTEDTKKGMIEKKLYKLRERELELFTMYFEKPWKIFFINFFAGTAKGLGFFLGAAIVIAILTYFLGQFLSGVPYLGDFFQNASEWLKATQPGKSIQ
jgi:hypothetical protein